MYLVLSLNQYRFPQEGTGQIMEGISIQIADEPDPNGRIRGLGVTKITAPLDSLEQFVAVPGYYDIDFKMRPGRGGKGAELVFQEAKYVKPLNLDFSRPKVAAGQ